MKSNSFLRWAGSKQQLVPELAKHWDKNKYHRYIEPFMGSAKLFFSLDVDNAILSDINHELIEVFNKIKKDPSPIFRILQTYEVSKDNYYSIRSLDPQKMGINQRVARFLYLNKLCFNGLYRTNSKGVFNVPYSGATRINYEQEFQVIKASAQKLQNAIIVHGDFECVVKSHVKAGDFVYLDPPYAVENRRIFKQYGPQTFGMEDMIRMKELLKHIDKVGATFLLSYAYCKEAIEIFGDWPSKKKFTQRNISGFAKYRRKAAEILVSNNFK